MNTKEALLEKLQNRQTDLLIGGFITFSLLVIIVIQFGLLQRISTASDNVMALFDSSSLPRLTKSSDSLKLTDAINYITPSVSPSPHRASKVAENGEISSIQSGQVTYFQNRYVVQEGDSLMSIAEQAYGDRGAWPIIAEANSLPSPDYIEVGMELVLPRN